MRGALDALPPFVHPFFFLGLADLDRRLLAPPPRVLGGDAGLELALALRGEGGFRLSRRAAAGARVDRRTSGRAAVNEKLREPRAAGSAVSGALRLRSRRSPRRGWVWRARAAGRCEPTSLGLANPLMIDYFLRSAESLCPGLLRSARAGPRRRSASVLQNASANRRKRQPSKQFIAEFPRAPASACSNLGGYRDHNSKRAGPGRPKNEVRRRRDYARAVLESHCCRHRRGATAAPLV